MVRATKKRRFAQFVVLMVLVFYVPFCCCFNCASLENRNGRPFTDHKKRIKSNCWFDCSRTVHGLQINKTFSGQRNERKKETPLNMEQHQKKQHQKQLMQITSLDKMCLQMITLLCMLFSLSSQCSYLVCACIMRLDFVWAFIHAPTHLQWNLISFSANTHTKAYAHLKSDYVGVNKHCA